MKKAHKSPETLKDPARRRLLKIGVKIGIGAGAAVIEEATLGIGRRLLKASHEKEAPPNPIETKKYRFNIDGFIVESNSVTPEEFRSAYKKAKKITGGLFWQPKKLSIEYGNVAQEHFRNAAIVQRSDTRVEASFTNDNLDEITTNHKAICHELIHFLLGSESKKWPDLLAEIISAAADEPETRFPYDALDQEWIQMPTGESMYSGSPLTVPRYAAIEHIGQRYADKMPEIVQAAFSRSDLDFYNLAEFLEKFGIKHHILTPGKSGDFFAFIPYQDPQKSGYVYVRYRRQAEQGEEFGWTGPAQTIFTDENGQEYIGEPFQMQGVTFVYAPQTAAKLVEIAIRHPDGEWKNKL